MVGEDDGLRDGEGGGDGGMLPDILFAVATRGVAALRCPNAETELAVGFFRDVNLD